jgi:hypothetical protein
MYKSENYNVHQFDNISAFLEEVKKVGCLEQHGSDPWVNNISAHGAINFSKTGKDNCVVAAEKLISSFDMQILTDGWEDTPSVAGCYPCVPDALMGEPECMREPVAVESTHSPLTIVVDLICSATFSAEQMAKRGSAIMAFVMAMSAMRPVTLKLCSTNCGPSQSDGNAYSIVSVDIATSPLDLATTAYMISDVSFVRHLFYAYQQEHLGSKLKWPSINGYSCTSEAFAEGVKKYLDIDGDWVYIPPAWAGNYDNDLLNNPAVWVKRMLEKIPA